MPEPPLPSKVLPPDGKLFAVTGQEDDPMNDPAPAPAREPVSRESTLDDLGITELTPLALMRIVSLPIASKLRTQSSKAIARKFRSKVIQL